MRFHVGLAAVCSMLCLGGSWAGAEPQAPSKPAHAQAILAGTAPSSPITGTVSFMDTPEGVHVMARVAHASRGPHGFHIHEHGNCGDSGNAAGGHFNPRAVPHGYLPRDGASQAHAGDMGNIDVGADGEGTLDVVLPGLSLTRGTDAIAGRAVILHENADDFGQPTGNAGGRIACGVIEPSD